LAGADFSGPAFFESQGITYKEGGQLVQQICTYSSNTIATFAAAGVMPDYVQVGNQIWSYYANRLYVKCEHGSTFPRQGHSVSE
jgi:arabinogalactan endo-1,4-beta-galactosidase